MLHWTLQMLPCVIALLASVSAAGVLIWRYEGCSVVDGGEEMKKSRGVVYTRDVWLSCIRNLHPAYLLVYRFMCAMLFTTLAAIAIARDPQLRFYYTEWTFLLVTLYFWLATGMSVYGCRNFHPDGLDGQAVIREVAGFWGYLVQVIYQTSAGAVMMTDFIYWIILFPHIVKTYDINFWSVMPHTFNAIFLLGECALNRMGFPWFRIAYLFLWTSTYVLFQWAVHTFSAINWWPYPFLDLSAHLAPLWYVLAGLLQVPCYFAFMLAMLLKRRLFAKWFPARFIQA